MARLRNGGNVGSSPGTLAKAGNERVRIRVIDYDEAHIEEHEVKSAEECFPFRDKPSITWINVDGIHKVDLIEKLGQHFTLHPLILEDILNTGQRPKMDDYGSYLFLVLKMLTYDEPRAAILTEQLSIILGVNYVISFQEDEGDIFDPIRERIRGGKGRIRKMGADYLAYALIDAIVDHYFVIIEKVGERLEVLEEELVTNPRPETLNASTA
jgi:magnesium transporter